VRLAGNEPRLLAGNGEGGAEDTAPFCRSDPIARRYGGQLLHRSRCRILILYLNQSRRCLYVKMDRRFIQRAEHRNTQAIHAKLDELLRAENRARDELTRLDDEEPEVIERHRSDERKVNE
jgi:hypothetical protein